jgi:hypothetical protein
MAKDVGKVEADVASKAKSISNFYTSFPSKPQEHLKFHDAIPDRRTQGHVRFFLSDLAKRRLVHATDKPRDVSTACHHHHNLI